MDVAPFDPAFICATRPYQDLRLKRPLDRTATSWRKDQETPLIYDEIVTIMKNFLLYIMKQVHGLDCLISWTGCHGLGRAWWCRDSPRRPHAAVEA
jgi:hypothetical protein